MSLLSVVERPEAPTASRARRFWSWTAVIAAVIAIGVLLVSLRYDWSEPQPLEADSPRADGARAAIALLERQGVEVHVVDTAADARRAAARADSSGRTTLAVTDASMLAPEVLRELADDMPRTVVLGGDYAALDAVFPGIGFGGSGDGSAVAPACDLPEAKGAGEIIPGEAYAAPGATGCYPVGDGYALVSSGTVTALDGAAIVDNEHLATAGHAALMLQLLGQGDSVAWLDPSGADLNLEPRTLGDLVPAWVTPALVLAALVAVAAGIWRGRRFGPLVAENLPVTVRASETLEGRARLYRDGRDPGHAYHLLVRGAVIRMARRVGLTADADDESLARALAHATGRDPREIYDTLTASPAGDADLATLGARLRALETDLDSAHPWENR